MDKEVVTKVIQNKVKEFGAEIVEFNISSSNSITLMVDNKIGITVGECGKISRAIESEFDRDEEDFDIVVSTPGLDSPLKLPFQFEKNIGREIVIWPKEGKKYEAKLLSFSEDSIEVEYIEITKIDKKKKKEILKKTLLLSDIDKVKVVISFK